MPSINQTLKIKKKLHFLSYSAILGLSNDKASLSFRIKFKYLVHFILFYGYHSNNYRMLDYFFITIIDIFSIPKKYLMDR